MTDPQSDNLHAAEPAGPGQPHFEPDHVPPRRPPDQAVSPHNEGAGAEPVHPVSTGIGAAGVGVAGAAIGGAIGGPIGAAAGAALGALAGGLLGHGIAVKLDPAAEEDYWRKHHVSRAAHYQDQPFEDFLPAYQIGWEGADAHHDQPFEQMEPALMHNWESRRGASRLTWEEARDASRQAWDRVHEQRLGKVDQGSFENKPAGEQDPIREINLHPPEEKTGSD